jgi:hypothetical protein
MPVATTEPTPGRARVALFARVRAAGRAAAFFAAVLRAG